MSNNVSVTSKPRGQGVAGQGLCKSFFGIPVLSDVSSTTMNSDVCSEVETGKPRAAQFFEGVI